jgi:hypothetical protein
MQRLGLSSHFEKNGTFVSRGFLAKMSAEAIVAFPVA